MNDRLIAVAERCCEAKAKYASEGAGSHGINRTMAALCEADLIVDCLRNGVQLPQPFSPQATLALLTGIQDWCI